MSEIEKESQVIVQVGEPTQTTIAALNEARAIEEARYKNIKDLIQDLNAEEPIEGESE
jgi:hypothetical protein